MIKKKTSTKFFFIIFLNLVTCSSILHINKVYIFFGGTKMSDLAATNCGCNSCGNGGFSNSWLIILIFLFIFGGNCFGNIMGGGCGCNDDCGCNNSICGGNTWIWLIIILLFCNCGNSGFGGCGCGCSCGCGCN